MSEEVTIREAVVEDLAAITGIYNHYVMHTHITFDLKPAALADRGPWFSKYNRDAIHRLLVAEQHGRVVGYASSSRFRVKPAYDNSVETTIYLDPEATGQGTGSRLYGALIDELASTSVHRCYGVIALPNDASIRLHQQLGFVEVGHLTEVGYKFDRYWDTLWLEKRLT